jgi:hypothetical protein
MNPEDPLAVLQHQLDEACTRLLNMSRDASPEMNRAAATILRSVADRLDPPARVLEG